MKRLHWLLRALFCAALPLSSALAQDDGYRQPPQVDATTLALNWILGRYRMPMTCTRSDDSRVHLEESVVVRPAPQHGPTTLKATFFGIDVGNATHCYNIVKADRPDARGVLYFTYRSSGRKDLGGSDFRHSLRDGELTYQITGGVLRIGAVDAAPEKKKAVAFGGTGSTLTVRLLIPAEDGFKLLEGFARNASAKARPLLRRLEFRIDGPESFSFGGYYLEDAARWK